MKKQLNKEKKQTVLLVASFPEARFDLFFFKI